MERNPFDQFDAPSGASSTGQNVFDQFDQPDEIVTLPAVQAAKPDFSEVASSWDSTAELPCNAPGRWLGQYGGRQVLQGAGGLLGAVGGDAFNHHVVDPIRRRLHQPTEEDIATGGTASFRLPRIAVSASRLRMSWACSGPRQRRSALFQTLAKG